MQWSTPKLQEAPRQAADSEDLASCVRSVHSEGSVLWEQTLQMVLTQGSSWCESEQQCYKGGT